MVNVDLKFAAPQTRDNLRTVITSSNHIIIQKLKNFNFMIQNIRNFEGKIIKSLTKDTVSRLSQTHRALVYLGALINEYLL